MNNERVMIDKNIFMSSGSTRSLLPKYLLERE